MNFQQLKYVRAAIHNGLNLSQVASVLFTSQSGVSKQIKELETEIGVKIFVRQGKRLIGLTKAGEKVVKIVENILAEHDNLKRLSQNFTHQDQGRLVIATTHNQARYALPQVLLRFMQLYPDVEVELRQGTPKYIVDCLLKGLADVGLATETLVEFPELKTFPCFSWEHHVVVQADHPLAQIRAPGLADIARYPIITYNPEFSGRSHIDDAFKRMGIKPDIRLTAMDADVIKTYVRLGMGVGIVAEMALSDHDARGGLVVLDGTNRFFEPSVTKIAVLRGTLLRNFAGRLIELFAPQADCTAPNRTSRRTTASHQKILSYTEWLEHQVDPGSSDTIRNDSAAAAWRPKLLDTQDL